MSFQIPLFRPEKRIRASGGRRSVMRASGFFIYVLTDSLALIESEARTFPLGFYHTSLLDTTTCLARLRSLDADALGKIAYVELMQRRYDNGSKSFKPYNIDDGLAPVNQMQLRAKQTMWFLHTNCLRKGRVTMYRQSLRYAAIFKTKHVESKEIGFDSITNIWWEWDEIREVMA